MSQNDMDACKCAIKRCVIYNTECTRTVAGAHAAPEAPKLDLGEWSQDREETQWKQGNGRMERKGWKIMEE